MAQSRPNVVHLGGVVIVNEAQGSNGQSQSQENVGESSLSPQGQASCCELYETHCDCQQKTAVIKSALKKRDLRTPSPSPQMDAASGSASGSISASPSTEGALQHHMELQSPYDDGDYIRRFLSSAAAASRQSVRFDQEYQPHNNKIDVSLEDNETISVHVGYLQLDCAYSVEFSIPADLLLQVHSASRSEQQPQPQPASNSCTDVNEPCGRFLRRWRVERVHSKLARLIRTEVSEETASICFEFEFRAAKEKTVAQRFVLVYDEREAAQTNDVNVNVNVTHDAPADARRVNVVLVCRVFPRTKGSAMLRDGVHLLNHQGRRPSATPFDTNAHCSDLAGPSGSGSGSADCTTHHESLKPPADN